MQTPTAASPPTPSGTQPLPAAATAPAVSQKTRLVYRGTGVIWALVATLVCVVLLVILIAQNTADVTIHFLWFTPEVSLVVLVLASVTLAVSVTELAGLVWRHRRRHRLTQRDELRRLQADLSRAPIEGKNAHDTEVAQPPTNTGIGRL